jgi:FMN phosphatase YigB (HAD superfamily)
MIKAVVFDWGDTLMRVFPEYGRSMAGWTYVESMPGVMPALAELCPTYRLYIATNASDSGAILVRAALRRAGLEEFFAGVFTSKELKVRKPDLGFYQAGLRESSVAPGEAAIEEDDYPVDILDPKLAGLRAIWYNPTGFPGPEDRQMHDPEIHSMSELPIVLGNLDLHESNKRYALSSPAEESA